MNSAYIRAFATSTRNALKIVGGTKMEVVAYNPGNTGLILWEGVEGVQAEANEIYGDRAYELRIQGMKLHKSTKDPKETKSVITVSVHTKNGTRLMSSHIREDGTRTKHETRAGRRNKTRPGGGNK